ncbi:hypothetical protein O0L34_g13303 [Tuta absoluta]|nr:hypothetical protein O0L34_g13303 [Tuta absoluta]
MTPLPSELPRLGGATSSCSHFCSSGCLQRRCTLVRLLTHVLVGVGGRVRRAGRRHQLLQPLLQLGVSAEEMHPGATTHSCAGRCWWACAAGWAAPPAPAATSAARGVCRGDAPWCDYSLMCWSVLVGVCGGLGGATSSCSHFCSSGCLQRRCTLVRLLTHVLVGVGGRVRRAGRRHQLLQPLLQLGVSAEEMHPGATTHSCAGRCWWACAAGWAAPPAPAATSAARGVCRGDAPWCDYSLMCWSVLVGVCGGLGGATSSCSHFCSSGCLQRNGAVTTSSSDDEMISFVNRRRHLETKHLIRYCFF